MIKMLQRNKLISVVLLLTGAMVGVLVAVVVVTGSSEPLTVVSSAVDVAQNQHTGTGMAIPGPTSIQELVNRSDTIIIGSIGPVRRTAMEGPNDDLSKYPQGVPLPLLSFTYYQINVEEVILDDGFIQSEPTLSLPGLPGNNGHLGFPMKLSSTDRYVFMLSRNPNNKSHGVVAYSGLLNLSGAVVTLADPNHTAPSFAKGVAPLAFVQAVKAAMLARQHVPPSQWEEVKVVPKPAQP